MPINVLRYVVEKEEKSNGQSEWLYGDKPKIKWHVKDRGREGQHIDRPEWVASFKESEHAFKFAAQLETAEMPKDEGESK